MKTSKKLLLRPKVIIPVIILVGILISMTTSELYYSNLEEQFPLLTKNESINGEVTSLKTHFDYSYIEINSKTKRLIRPTTNTKHEPCDFNDFISVGDTFIHDKFSNEIQVVRKDKTYSFTLTEYN